MLPTSLSSLACSEDAFIKALLNFGRFPCFFQGLIRFGFEPWGSAQNHVTLCVGCVCVSARLEHIGRRRHGALLPSTAGVNVYDLLEVPPGDEGRVYLQQLPPVP